MFRKTAIRLFLLTMVAITALIVFAAATNNQRVDTSNKECIESDKECKQYSHKTEFMILESIGRTLIKNTGY